MRILFINPSLRPGSPSRYLPVGLGYVVTLVRDAGFDFDLLDIDLNALSNDDVERYFRDHEYDVIMLGCIVTHYKWVKWCTKKIREYQPECKIVVGNSVAGSIPEVFLTHCPADVVIMGEGEYTAVEVLKSFQQENSLDNVQGIAFRNDDGRTIVNPPRPAHDINTIPMIDWELFDIQKYFDIAINPDVTGVKDIKDRIWRTMPVVTARGCIAKCTFCHYVFWNDPYRHRTAESIVAECKRNSEKYGANYIYFWDDLSFSSITQAEKVSDAILASGLDFKWSASVRSDLFGNPKISLEKRLDIGDKMRRSGCVNVGFALESANEEILKMMEKKVKVAYFEEAIRVLREIGLEVSTSVVFGYPIETKETIKETFEMLLRNSMYPSIGFLLPLPATGMYKYAKEHGYITNEDAFLESITERQDICLNMTKMSDEEILTEIKIWATRLNQMLGLDLNEDGLIKTGGYKKLESSTVLTDSNILDPENMSRNVNDFSFNYSQQVFDLKNSGSK